MPVIEGFVVGLATNLATILLERLHRQAFGVTEKKAIQQAFQQGFEAMLAHVGQGLSKAETQAVAEFLDRFLREPDIAQSFLDLALTDTDQDLDRLAKRFEEVMGKESLAGIRFDFDRSILVFHHGLMSALIKEASRQDSALANLVSLQRILHLQRLLEQVVELLQRPTQPAVASQERPDVPVGDALATPPRFYTCFISYSHNDEAFAERLHTDLQAAGVPCWFAPEDMAIGARVRQTIDEAIQGYDKLLVVLSQHSVDSAWVEKEVETAFDEERSRKAKGRDDWLMLFPLRLDEAVMGTREAWAADIRRMRYIGNFTQWHEDSAYGRAFNRVLRDLRKGDDA